MRHRAVSVADQIQTSTIVATISSASPRLTARRAVGRSMSLFLALAHEEPIDAEDRPVLEAVADLAAVAMERHSS